MPSTGNLPAIYQEEFTPVFDKCYEKRNSVSNVSTAHTYYLLSQQTNFANVLWHDNTNLRVPGSYQTDMLTSEDISALLIVYKALSPHIKNISVSGLHNTIKKFASIFLGAQKFGSKSETRSLRSAPVLASWNSSNGLIRATAPLSPGIVDYFMCHKVNIDGMEREHYFAYVRWFKKHPHKHCLGSFNSLCVWDSNNFESRGPSCFLPVHRIHSLFTGAHISVDSLPNSPPCQYFSSLVNHK